MIQHKVLPKLHHLYLMRDGTFTPVQWLQLETLDQGSVEGMQFAEKKCQKLSMGNVDFSSEVDLAQKRRKLWQLKREGKPVSAGLIKWNAR